MLFDDYKVTDPEYAGILNEFACREVSEEGTAQLNGNDRWLAILATLLGCQGKEAFALVLKEALQNGLTAVEAREVVYQATDYLGIGRVMPFVNVMNDVFKNEGIALPLAPQATVTAENRLEKGVATQVEIFGDRMKEAWKTGTINKWLGDNCFGDYYTRTGLELRQRELITFCFLAGQGGCEPQLTSHAKGNMNLGNSAEYLKRVVLQCVPYIGYPRSLNALRCIQEATEK